MFHNLSNYLQLIISLILFPQIFNKTLSNGLNVQKKLVFDSLVKLVKCHARFFFFLPRIISCVGY